MTAPLGTLQETGHIACYTFRTYLVLLTDFVTRQKPQSTHLNWFIVEQLPVVPPENYDALRFGPRTAGEIVREAVLELTYTAHDMAPFARDMGHVDAGGAVLPPYVWDAERRLRLRIPRQSGH